MAALQGKPEILLQPALQAVAIGIETIVAQFIPDQRVDRTHPLPVGRDAVDAVQRDHLVRNRQVQAEKILLVKERQGAGQIFRRNLKTVVGPVLEARMLLP